MKKSAYALLVVLFLCSAIPVLAGAGDVYKSGFYS
jgi:hypothetical protein